jgi:hypothetical protein
MPVKSIISGFLCLVFSVSCYADYDVADLKKLFTDKNQRAQIDAARTGYHKNSAVKKARQVNVKGYVTRSDGKNVAWINDNNTLKKVRVDNVKVHGESIGKNKKVGVTVNGKHIRLKPGETWSESSGVSDIGK